jgi:hypothetical protein
MALEEFIEKTTLKSLNVSLKYIEWTLSMRSLNNSGMTPWMCHLIDSSNETCDVIQTPSVKWGWKATWDSLKKFQWGTRLNDIEDYLNVCLLNLFLCRFNQISWCRPKWKQFKRDNQKQTHKVQSTKINVSSPKTLCARKRSEQITACSNISGKFESNCYHLQ